MAIEVGSLLISMGADIARLSDDMGKARRTVDGAMSEIKRSAAAARSALEMIGVGVSVGAFSSFIKSSIDAADNLNDLSQKTGTSVETLAGLRLAAEQSGTSMEAIANSAKKLSTEMADKPELFKKFGVTATDSTGALIQLADIFARMPDGIEKAALAQQLFGKSGADMIPLLNQGGEALRQQIENGKEYNRVTAEMAAQADLFNDNLAELKMQASGLGITLANDMLPALNDIIGAMSHAAREGGLLKSVLVGVGGVMSESWAGIKGTLVMNDVANEHRIRRELEDANILIERYAKLKDEIGSAGFSTEIISGKLSAQYDIKAGLENELAALEWQRAEVERSKRVDASQREFNKAMRTYLSDGRGGRMLNELSPGKGGSGSKEQEHDVALRNWLWNVDAQYHEGLKKAQEAQHELDRTNAEMARRALEAQRIVADTDPIYKATLAWDELLSMVNDGLLTGEQAAKAYQKQFEPLTKEGEDSFKRLESAVRGWGNEFTNVMTRMVRTGKLEWGNLADSIINDLIRIQIQQSITDPLIASAKGMSFSSLGSFFGSGGSGSGSITSMSDIPGSTPIMSYAGGGYTGDGPRSGGLDGKGGFWAIMHPKENVTDYASGWRGSAPNVTVNLIGAPPGTKVEQRQDEGGGLTLDVIVGEIEAKLAQNISRGSGALNSTLNRTFGLNRSAGAY